jgi:hypothetical protein
MFEYVVPVVISAMGIQQVPDQPEPLVMAYLSRTTHDEAMIRPAMPIDIHDWKLGTADYPAELLGDRMTAHLHIDVSVGSDGRIADCVVTDARASRLSERFAPAPEFFARNACNAIREHGRFSHALDADGVARAGVVPIYMIFSAGAVPSPPSPPPPPPGLAANAAKPRDLTVLRLSPDPAMFTITDPSVWFDIDAKGRVTRCRVARSTGTDAGDATMCRQMFEGRFKPGRDRGGKVQPVKHQNVRLRVGEA